jgi:2-desacetyl-2-hydroxyethyl bacteriochlorophyllide A dehydrogenase
MIWSFSGDRDGQKVRGIKVKRQSLYFIEPGVVEIREELISKPGANQVLVSTLLSGISSGTEMLIYQGNFPENLALDEGIEAISGIPTYPLRYGYSTVGEILDYGEGVSPELVGKLVFSFQPHVSHFVTDKNSLQFVPEELSLEDAIFLPNMETAVNLLMDGGPVIGEKVIVLGQGVVGLLTTALLAQFPLSKLVTFDRYQIRRKASLDFGAQTSIDPANKEGLEKMLADLGEQGSRGADLVYELTGDPKGLDQAIELCGFDGCIVVGSFYGKKKAELDLGSWFHRSRIKMISSQVSMINPDFSGRWDKSRRYKLAWDMIEQVKPAGLITHKFPIEKADQVYRMLADRPEEMIQVAFTY